MDSPYATELKTAITAVQHAAALTKAVLAAANNRVGHIAKDDLSPVTKADFAVQALLTATLHAAFPGDSFVGEEDADELRANPELGRAVWELLEQAGAKSSVTESSQAQGCVVPESPEHTCELLDLAGRGEPGLGGRVWVFDPVDGTKTFLRGEIYAVNVCLMVDGKQTVAVVGLPNWARDVQPPVPMNNDSVDSSPDGGSILYAVRGQGSFNRPLVGPSSLVGSRIPRHDPNPAQEDLRLVTSLDADSAVPGLHEKIAGSLGVDFPGSDLLGWVPRWASLALGHANVTFWVYKHRQRLGKIWDHAGAMLLFEEAGGKITDVDGREPSLTAGRKMVANYGWVAAPEGVHAGILETVRESMKDAGHGDLLL